METVRHHTIAIEISGLYKIPSRKFILKGKAAGIKFSFGSNTHGEDVGMVPKAMECGGSTPPWCSPAAYFERAASSRRTPRRCAHQLQRDLCPATDNGLLLVGRGSKHVLSPLPTPFAIWIPF
jgi:hypothetical protein